MRNRNKPPQAAEHRAAARLLRRESVSIQILLPSMDDSRPAEVVASETIDISGQGMRVLLQEPLQTGRIFDICVELKEEPRRFLLTGETRWCRYSNKRKGHEVGLEILDGEGTDYAAWSSNVRVDTDRESE